MQRIVILGCGGSGKTTFSRLLGERIDAPVICLDAIWQPGWSHENVPAFRTLMEEAHAREKWISDGNFAAATFDIRLPRATIIVWLELPKLVCYWRAIKRVFKRGEAHRLCGLAKVIAFIWRFDRVNRPRIESLRMQHGPEVPVVHLKSDREVAEFLSSARSDGVSSASAVGP
ncbi:MAG: hypothetical protein KF784_08355 [Fimbriimonadaceae bacterium]|nr:hypothetical protein [Fimbriimonadaceae bacterium]